MVLSQRLLTICFTLYFLGLLSHGLLSILSVISHDQSVSWSSIISVIAILVSLVGSISQNFEHWKFLFSTYFAYQIFYNISLLLTCIGVNFLAEFLLSYTMGTSTIHYSQIAYFISKCVTSALIIVCAFRVQHTRS
jgi:uncharacterized membrane protein YjdF